MQTDGKLPVDSKTWLITGASSGLGFALAQYVLEQGDCAVLGARNLRPMSELVAHYPDTGLALTLDVTRHEDRAAAIVQAEGRFGGIDVLVNNAGIDFLGAIEEQEERDYRELFEVNFFAAVALLRGVLPGMRLRRQGTIINISSMDGIASLPVNGYYSASKFALEGLTESLWQEIEPLGLRAFLVEPGSFRTGIEQRTKFSGSVIDAYEATSGTFRKMVDTLSSDQFPGDLARFPTSFISPRATALNEHASDSPLNQACSVNGRQRRERIKNRHLSAPAYIRREQQRYATRWRRK